jgi:hypothetical protein
LIQTTSLSFVDRPSLYNLPSIYIERTSSSTALQAR